MVVGSVLSPFPLVLMTMRHVLPLFLFAVPVFAADVHHDRGAVTPQGQAQFVHLRLSPDVSGRLPRRSVREYASARLILVEAHVATAAFRCDLDREDVYGIRVVGWLTQVGERWRLSSAIVTGVVAQPETMPKCDDEDDEPEGEPDDQPPTLK